MTDILGAETTDLIYEIEKRGYRVRPRSFEGNLSYSEVVREDFNRLAFKWRAVHKIAGQLSFDHLRYNEEEMAMGQKVITAKLEMI